MSSKHPPKGNPFDTSQLTDTSVKGVQGKEGGTIAGKKGDHVNPWGDQDHNSGSVHPDQHMPENPDWEDVYLDDGELDKKRRKVAYHQESLEGLVRDVHALLTEDGEDVDGPTLLEVTQLVQEAVQAGVEERWSEIEEQFEGLVDLNEELIAENLELVCRIRFDDFTRGLTQQQKDRLWNLMVDLGIDMDADTGALTKLKEEVSGPSGKIRPRPFSEQVVIAAEGLVHAERSSVDPSMRTAVNILNTFRR